MSESDVLRLLEYEIEKAGSAMAYARHVGISTQYLCDIRRRRRGISTKLLYALGIVAIIKYEKMKEAPCLTR